MAKRVSVLDACDAVSVGNVHQRGGGKDSVVETAVVRHVNLLFIGLVLHLHWALESRLYR